MTLVAQLLLLLLGWLPNRNLQWCMTLGLVQLRRLLGVGVSPRRPRRSRARAGLGLG